MNVTCVVLAAGRSLRFGSPKLRARLDDRPLITRALEASAGYETVVVVSPELADEIPPAPSRRVVINQAPDRGMNFSLRCALDGIDPRCAIVVLLGDMPFVDAALVRRVVDSASDGVDVVVPMHEGRPVHPVLFGSRVRSRLQSLPDGDTIRSVRDAADLVRRQIVVADPRVALDVDLPRDFERARSEIQTVETEAATEPGR